MADHGKPKVGYKRPPQHTQFRSGQSGNPKGRPRRAEQSSNGLPQNAVDDVLRDELSRILSVGEGGQRKQMTALEVVARAQINSAAKGNALAQRDVLKSAYELHQRDAARAEAELSEARENYDLMVSYKARRGRIWSEAAGRGQEPENPWPHPDDVILSPSTLSARVRGPVFADCMPRYEYYRAERDAAFMQYVADLKAGKKLALWETWALFDILLPKRWQILFDTEVVGGVLLSFPLPKLQAWAEQYAHAAAKARYYANLGAPSKESLALTDEIMRPILDHYGYKSVTDLPDFY